MDFPSSSKYKIQNTKYKIRGFTLIELLIAFSLTGIISAVGLTSYRNYLRRQAVVQAAKQLKTDLRLLQQKAMSGEKDCIAGEDDITVCNPTGICGDFDDRKLDGWFLSVNTTDDTYTYYGQCGAGNTFGSKTVSLSEGINITVAGSNPLMFYPISRSAGGTSDTTYTLTSSDQNATVTVTIQGQIE